MHTFKWVIFRCGGCSAVEMHVGEGLNNFAKFFASFVVVGVFTWEIQVEVGFIGRVVLNEESTEFDNLLSEIWDVKVKIWSELV